MIKSYIQYGLIGVALALVFLRMREGFEIEGSSPAKCKDGSTPNPFSDLCIDKTSTPIDKVCPEGSTDNANGNLPCLYASGGRGGKNCPRDTQEDNGKCYKLAPVCPSGTDAYLMYRYPIDLTIRTFAFYEEKSVCVPSSLPYPLTPFTGSPDTLTNEKFTNQCRPGDRIGVRLENARKGDDETGRRGMRCIPARVAVTNTTATAAKEEESLLASSIRNVTESLRPFRPPTAPASDLEKERKEITMIAKQNLFFIQIALFLVVLAMLGYIMFPLESANLIAFALLSVGIATGFFLKG